ncbi:hypothetical protein [Flavobacterium procerum]|uniref:hypothetical protein n=1 Tax=Flavobacterium procerum TaxID=1455569 RepID=UPI0036D2B203
MNKLNLFQNKILSILLILILTFLSYKLLPDNFKDAKSIQGIIYNAIPVFTIFFSGFVYVYEFKKKLSKILFALLILLTLSNLILRAIVLQIK